MPDDCPDAQLQTLPDPPAGAAPLDWYSYRITELLGIDRCAAEEAIAAFLGRYAETPPDEAPH